MTYRNYLKEENVFRFRSICVLFHTPESFQIWYKQRRCECDQCGKHNLRASPSPPPTHTHDFPIFPPRWRSCSCRKRCQEICQFGVGFPEKRISRCKKKPGDFSRYMTAIENKCSCCAHVDKQNPRNQRKKTHFLFVRLKVAIFHFADTFTSRERRCWRLRDNNSNASQCSSSPSKAGNKKSTPFKCLPQENYPGRSIDNKVLSQLQKMFGEFRLFLWFLWRHWLQRGGAAAVITRLGGGNDSYQSDELHALRSCLEEEGKRI